MSPDRSRLRVFILSLTLCLVASCGGGGGGSSSGTTGSGTGGGGTTPPPTPAPFNDIPQTDAEAARFLTQATFGPTRSEIARLRQIGYTRWLDEQMDAARTPATLLLPHIHQMTVNDTLDYRERRNYWLWKTVSASDQLRMRMGFALSQIFVVSDFGYSIKNFERITHYQDTLSQGAFGSYRVLLEQVSLHPAMGTYLSHLGNQKAVSYKNAQGIQVSVVPDENYAREVMQLFSIGLVERNPDFSVAMDASGASKPTYDQAVIGSMARVFTVGPGLAIPMPITGVGPGMTITIGRWSVTPSFMTSSRRRSFGASPLRGRVIAKSPCSRRWMHWPAIPTWRPSSAAN